MCALLVSLVLEEKRTDMRDQVGSEWGRAQSVAGLERSSIPPGAAGLHRPLDEI
jgi:hypothetical protein